MKYLMYVCSFLFLALGANAQADQDLKAAKKKLKKYYLDPSNTEVLNEAKTAILSAVADPGIAGDVSAWITQGKIFNELANEEFKSKSIDPSHTILNRDAPVMAANALMKAYGMTEKKADRKDILKSLSEAETHVNNFAIYAYQDQNFGDAFSNFDSSIKLADFLSASGATSRLAEGTFYDEQVLYAAVSGYNAEPKGDVKPHLLKLYEKGSNEPFVYEGLYGIAAEEGDENAISYLEKGRELFPDDTGLLFAIINHYLTSGNLEPLTSQLDAAIQAEPDNVSVYTTSGNVYDQLAQQSRKNGDETGAEGHFAKAMSYYTEALSRDANNFEANYGIGQMYYNKAADLVPALNTLSEDYSKEGIGKYDALKGKMDGLFGEALPYFEKSEAANGGDLNTIIALKEIHARLNNVDKSNEYKAKFDKLSGN